MQPEEIGVKNGPLAGPAVLSVDPSHPVGERVSPPDGALRCGSQSERPGSLAEIGPGGAPLGRRRPLVIFMP